MGSVPSAPVKDVVPQTARLCLQCQRLFQHWDDRVKGTRRAHSKTSVKPVRFFPHDIDIPTWISSPHDECSLCSSLLRCMTEDDINQIKKCSTYSRFQVYLSNDILNFSVVDNDWNTPLFYEIHFPASAQGMFCFLGARRLALILLDD